MRQSINYSSGFFILKTCNSNLKATGNSHFNRNDIYRLPLKTPHKKFAICFCLLDKVRYFSWHVVIIHQALLDIAGKTRCRYPYNVPTQIIPFVKKTQTAS